jgi:hypothetical protein
MANAMSNHEAWLYAASWGSYMTGGDPGACMYGFNESFLVQSEEHRQACLTWMEGCRANVLASPANYEPDELESMASFVEALKLAKVDQ